MRTIALVLACLSCGGHGRRLEKVGEQIQEGPSEEHGTLKKAGAGAPKHLKMLAILLAALHTVNTPSIPVAGTSLGFPQSVNIGHGHSLAVNNSTGVHVGSDSASWPRRTGDIGGNLTSDYLLDGGVRKRTSRLIFQLMKWAQDVGDEELPPFITTEILSIYKQLLANGDGLYDLHEVDELDAHVHGSSSHMASLRDPRPIALPASTVISMWMQIISHFNSHRKPVAGPVKFLASAALDMCKRIAAFVKRGPEEIFVLPGRRSEIVPGQLPTEYDRFHVKEAHHRKFPLTQWILQRMTDVVTKAEIDKGFYEIVALVTKAKASEAYLPSNIFAMATISKRWRKDRTGQLGEIAKIQGLKEAGAGFYNYDRVPVVKIEALVATPMPGIPGGLGKELLIQIVRHAAASGALVVLTPANSRLRQYYRENGFERIVGDYSGDAVYSKPVPEVTDSGFLFEVGSLQLA